MPQNKLREGLESGRFVVTAELIPGRGACEVNQEKELEEGRKIVESGLVDAISITDNPGGNPALLADAFALDVAKFGLTPLVHMTCKDRNRNQFESQLYAMERNGLENLLIMSGDYPTSGWAGIAKASFDLDPVTMTMQTLEFNKGMPQPGRKPGTLDTLKEGHFFPGCVVNPYKYTEGELIPQFTKLKKKIFAGAKFCIAQLGYDSRAQEAVLKFMKDEGIEIPFIANIYVLTAGAGRFMNQGNIPGTTVTDEFLQILNDERDNSSDKGKMARLERAAKMIAIAKGQGCAGVHIGGTGTTAENIKFLLERSEELLPEWEKWADEISYGKRDGYFYYQMKEGHPGANTDEKMERKEDEYRAVKENYGLSHWFHKAVFLPGKNLEPIFHAREVSLYKKKGLHRKHGLEHMGKVMLFHCIDCGDCGLPACAYTCPMSQCPKHQRNGPCGGSYNGWCEVFPNEKYCIWYKAYYRLKHFQEEGKLDDYITVPNDWRFWQTSGWQSYHTNQDNFAKRVWLPDAEPDFEAKHGRIVDWSDKTIPHLTWTDINVTHE